MDMMSLTLREINRLLESGKQFSLADVYREVEKAIREAHCGLIPANECEGTDANSAPRWKTRARIKIAEMAKGNSPSLVRIGHGLYVSSNSTQPDDAEISPDESILDENSSGGYIYILSVASMNGLIKIGRTIDLESRIARHRSGFSNIGHPDAPMLEAAWVIKIPSAAEKVIHGILRMNGKQYQGSGSGTEWFSANIDEVKRIISGQDLNKHFSPVSTNRINAINAL